MFSRTWHGVTPIEFCNDFEKYEYETGVKDTTNVEGNLGAHLRVIKKGEFAHFFLCLNCKCKLNKNLTYNSSQLA